MSIEVKVPVLPESVSDATIAAWHKKAGDPVRRDENLLDLETDKVVLEVPSPVDGVLKELKFQPGDTVTSQQVVAIIEEGAVAAAPAPAAAAPAKAAAPSAPAKAAPAAAPAKAAGKSDLPPGAAAHAARNDVNPADVEGTGRGGRVTKEDVVNHIKVGGGARPEQRVPMTRIRQRIAERMMQSKNSIAMLTSFNEVNLGKVMAMRKELGEGFEKSHGIKLGFMSFFAKAAANALQKYPVVNASVDGSDVIYHGFADISIAVATDKGLVTPVLRNVENMSFADIEESIAGYAKAAREGGLKLEDLQGGTFTITNGGTFGSLMSTPIVNPPQSAILGMHAIKERPIAENGQVVIAPMMYIALSYDHRIIDGKDAVLFLVDIKNQLENPHRMLLGALIMADQYDVVVIGAGPAGYHAAIRAAQLGLKTACIDAALGKDGKPALGGTCLRVGCIPSKALLDSSRQWHNLHHLFGEHGITTGDAKIDVGTMIGRKDKIVKQFTGGIAALFKANKVTPFYGFGTLHPNKLVKVKQHDGSEVELQGKHVILAAGSDSIELPFAKFDGDRIVDNVGALDFAQVPKRLGVIGAGVIGLELGSVWKRLGAEVTILEALPDFLAAADAEVAKVAAREFKKQGLDIRLGAKVSKVDAGKDGLTLTYADAKGEQTIVVDKLLVSVGRRAATKGLLADGTGVKLDARGMVEVDAHCATGVEGVWAVGDCVRGPMLAHKGFEEGIAVAELIAGLPGHVNFDTIPWVIYTEPEIAWVGKTEQQLAAEGIPYKAGSFPFAAVGRAVAMAEPAGFVKVLAHEETDRILGMHLVGVNVSELVHEGVLAMEFHGSAEDLARICHAHPTLSEAIHDAAMAVDKRAIHKAN